MPILHLLNLIAASLLTLWPLWFSRRYLHLPRLNPLTIALVVSLPVEIMKLFGGPLALLDNGLFDEGYQFAIFASNILLLSQIAGLVFFFRCCAVFRLDLATPLRKMRALTSRDLSRGALFFLALFAVSLYLLASAEFGVLQWLANPREGYQLHRAGQGHWYGLALSSLSVSLLLSFLPKPTAAAVLSRMPIYIALAYLLGSKGTVLNFFVSALTFLWFLHWPHLKKLILFGTPLLFAVLVWILYLSFTDLFELQSIVEYFDYYKNGADYYRAYLNNEIQLYWGKIMVSSYAAYIPRAVWPDKPWVYGILNIVEVFYPGQAELTNTPAFGGAVEQFADFGFPGLVMNGFFSSSMILTAATTYLIFVRPRIHFGRVTLATVAMLLVQFVPTFGVYFPGFLYGALLLVVVLSLRLLRRGKRRQRAAYAVVGDVLAITPARSSQNSGPKVRPLT